MTQLNNITINFSNVTLYGNFYMFLGEIYMSLSIFLLLFIFVLLSRYKIKVDSCNYIRSLSILCINSISFILLIYLYSLWNTAFVSQFLFNSRIHISPEITFIKSFVVCAFLCLLFFFKDHLLSRKMPYNFELYVLMLISVLALVMLVMVNDFLTLFFCLELYALSAYILVSYNTTSVYSTEAGLKYFVLGSFVSGFLAYGIFLLYYQFGTLNFTELSMLLFDGHISESSIDLWANTSLKPIWLHKDFMITRDINNPVLIDIKWFEFDNSFFLLMKKYILPWINSKVFYNPYYVYLYSQLSIINSTINPIIPLNSIFLSNNHFYNLISIESCGIDNLLTSLTSFDDFMFLYIDSVWWIFLPMMFILAALLFKLSAAPFHVWTPDAYEGAPLIVTAFLSIVPKISLLYVLIKILWVPFYNLYDDWITAIVFSAILSLVVGSIVALYQLKLKRLFIYSMIVNIGYFLLAINANSMVMWQYLLVYLIYYVMVMISIFIFLSLFKEVNSSFHLDRITNLTNLFYIHPFLSILLTVLLFALIGLPPLALFIGKVFIFYSIIYNYILTFISILLLSLSVYYYLRLIKIIYFFKKDYWVFLNPISRFSSFFLIIICFFLIFFIFYPQILFNLTAQVTLLFF